MNSNEILMQVETIITDPENLSYNSDGILITPIINNRKVETFVRVENNNPFIIGGLISDKKYDNTSGVPLLSKIPLLGKLFSNEGKNNVKKEVIIVLTPHIISKENKSFSRVIPQNSHLFDLWLLWGQSSLTTPLMRKHCVPMFLSSKASHR